MKNEKCRIWGLIVILLGLAVFCIGLSLNSEPVSRLTQIICFSSFLLFALCLFVGLQLLRKSRGEKVVKAYEIEKTDERNIAISGKAAYITMFTVFVLNYLFSAFLCIQGSKTAGYICLGITIACLILYEILCSVFKRN